MIMEHWWIDTDIEKLKTWRETCLNATLNLHYLG